MLLTNCQHVRDWQYNQSNDIIMHWKTDGYTQLSRPYVTKDEKYTKNNKPMNVRNHKVRKSTKVVHCCALYGNATHIANTRYRTTQAKKWQNWVRSSYNQIAWGVSIGKKSELLLQCSQRSFISERSGLSTAQPEIINKPGLQVSVLGGWRHIVNTVIKIIFFFFYET